MRRPSPGGTCVVIGRAQVSDKWIAKMSVMKENVTHHLQEEEEELFGQAQQVLDREQIRRIGEQIARMRH